MFFNTSMHTVLLSVKIFFSCEDLRGAEQFEGSRAKMPVSRRESGTGFQPVTGLCTAALVAAPRR